jgi:RNA polymerase sigma-70 factor (ECF subfamily)
MTVLEFFTQFNNTASSLQSEALHLTKNEDEARELYQETVHRALQRKHEVIDATSFSTWAFGLMQSIFAKKRRHPG